MNQWRSGLREDWPKWPSGYARLRLPNTCASKGEKVAMPHQSEHLTRYMEGGGPRHMLNLRKCGGTIPFEYLNEVIDGIR